MYSSTQRLETSKKEKGMVGPVRMMEEVREDQGWKVAPRAMAPEEEEEVAAEGLAAEVVKAGTRNF